MRGWREFWNPALKCERVGHALRIEWRRGYIEPTEPFSRAVVHKVREERLECARCGSVPSWAWTETNRRDIHSYSAPESVWDRVRDGGYWFERGHTSLPDDTTGQREGG